MCSVIIIYTTTTEHVLELFQIFSARGSTGAGVALAALRRGHVDAALEQGQVCRGELETSLPCFAIDAGRGIEFLKCAGLEPLEVGITIPSFLCRYTNFARSGCCWRESSVAISIGRDVSWE
jgi:hypothetical protein